MAEPVMITPARIAAAGLPGYDHYAPPDGLSPSAWMCRETIPAHVRVDVVLVCGVLTDEELYGLCLAWIRRAAPPANKRLRSLIRSAELGPHELRHAVMAERRPRAPASGVTRGQAVYRVRLAIVALCDRDVARRRVGSASIAALCATAIGLRGGSWESERAAQAEDVRRLLACRGVKVSL